MDKVLNAIRQMIDRAAINETEGRDTYADGYCNGLRSALDIVHKAAQTDWQAAMHSGIKFDGAGDFVKAPGTPPVTVSVEGGIGGAAGGNTYVSGTTSRDVLDISETLRDQTKKAWPI